MGRTSFAVEEYLKAIRLMPEQNEFLAMIYDNLAECYEEEDLDDVAMEAYRSLSDIERRCRTNISIKGYGTCFFAAK